MWSIVWVTAEWVYICAVCECKVSYQTSKSTVLEKLIVTQAVGNFVYFTEESFIAAFTNLSLVHILSRMNLVHNTAHHSVSLQCSWYPSVYVSGHPGRLFPSYFPTKTFYALLVCLMYVTWPSYYLLILSSSQLFLSTNVGSLYYKTLHVSYYFLLHLPSPGFIATTTLWYLEQ